MADESKWTLAAHVPIHLLVDFSIRIERFERDHPEHPFTWVQAETSPSDVVIQLHFGTPEGRDTF